MPYPGGKAGAGVYQRIINQIPPHKIYIEPFAGDAAVARRKRPADRTVLVELDPDQARALAAASAGGSRTPKRPGAGRNGKSTRQDAPGVTISTLGGTPLPPWTEVHQCCGIEWLKHAFGLYRVSGSEVRGQRSAVSGQLRRDRRPRNGVAGSTGPDVGPALDLPLSTLVYLDPPYLRSTRRSAGSLYRCELGEAQHVELLDVVRRLPCLVALSGYQSRLYADALKGWRSITFLAQTRGGRPAREVLWMNYPEPAELHDYRYLGDEKRERERISRKVRTWSAGLQRLPAHERQAIVAGISGGGSQLAQGGALACGTTP